MWKYKEITMGFAILPLEVWYVIELHWVGLHHHRDFVGWICKSDEHNQEVCIIAHQYHRTFSFTSLIYDCRYNESICISGGLFHLNSSCQEMEFQLCQRPGFIDTICQKLFLTSNSFHV